MDEEPVGEEDDIEGVSMGDDDSVSLLSDFGES
jgi:hypothetical protein